MPTRTTYPTVRGSDDGTALLLECPDCGASQTLTLPVSLTRAAYFGTQFNREHRTCASKRGAGASRLDTIRSELRVWHAAQDAIQEEERREQQRKRTT